MAQGEISHEIDSAKRKILEIVKGKVSPKDAERIASIMEEIKGKIRRGTI